jgi:Protein of unknown function (DUF1153)
MLEPEKTAARETAVVDDGDHPRDLDNLPPTDTRRWVYRRKAQVVDAVKGGRLTLDEACRRYAISHEEFASWERTMDAYGARGLKVTRLKEIRPRGAPG